MLCRKPAELRHEREKGGRGEGGQREKKERERKEEEDEKKEEKEVYLQFRIQKGHMLHFPW